MITYIITYWGVFWEKVCRTTDRLTGVAISFWYWNIRHEFFFFFFPWTQYSLVDGSLFLWMICLVLWFVLMCFNKSVKTFKYINFHIECKTLLLLFLLFISWLFFIVFLPYQHNSSGTDINLPMSTVWILWLIIKAHVCYYSCLVHINTFFS